jgi:hypothetical protein
MMNSIQILLNKVIRNDKEKKKKLINAMGYKNINKGFRRIDNCINTGILDSGILEKMISDFGINDETIELVKKIHNMETDIEKSKRELSNRLNFIPHLRRKNEREYPTPIFMAAVIGVQELKYVSLPDDFQNMDVFEQLENIKKIIITDFEERGHKGPFGKTTGYYYRKTFDETFEFTTDGDLIGNYKEKIRPKDASLTVKGRMIVV